MWNVGILGAGYIASHHINALKLIPNTKIIAICDRNIHQAHHIKKQVGEEVVIYPTLEKMLLDSQIDVIHLLLPPDLHFLNGEKILEAGRHLFIEKPMAVEPSQCTRLCRLAQSRQLGLGVNHNFLFFEVYKKFKQAIFDHQIGPLDTLSITWHKSLGQIHTGPFNIWMFRDPGNLMMEVGPHVVSPLLDLNFPFENFKAEADDPAVLPNGLKIFRRWSIFGEAGKTLVEIKISLGEGFDTHTIEAIGRIGMAKADFEKNTFVLTRHTDSSRPFDLYNMAAGEAYQIGKGAQKTRWKYLLSKCKLCKTGDPYFQSIYESIRIFYEKMPLYTERVQTGEFSTQVMELCKKIVQAAGIKEENREIPSPAIRKNLKAEILVLGGTGFIGKALVQALLRQNKTVRLLVRNPDSIDHSLSNEGIEVVQGDIRDHPALKEALKGIKTVYHLARGIGKTWEEYQEKGLGATKVLAEECLEAKIERLVYTGTIDSYYAGDPNVTITEETPLDPKIINRNFYARCKAAEEFLLKDLSKTKGLPLVIFRPGIVLGKGSSPFHWGVGMWHYGTVCRLWGKGENPLPFVWVEDVVNALIAGGELPDLNGQSFNLIDDPCLSGKEYTLELSNVLQSALEVKQTPIFKFYFYDLIKWIVKIIVRHPERKRPSYRDWLSRTQLSPYDCTKAKKILNWKPLSDRFRLIEEGIYNPAKEWFQ